MRVGMLVISPNYGAVASIFVLDRKFRNGIIILSNFLYTFKLVRIISLLAIGNSVSAKT